MEISSIKISYQSTEYKLNNVANFKSLVQHCVIEPHEKLSEKKGFLSFLGRPGPEGILRRQELEGLLNQNNTYENSDALLKALCQFYRKETEKFQKKYLSLGSRLVISLGYLLFTIFNYHHSDSDNSNSDNSEDDNLIENLYNDMELSELLVFQQDLLARIRNYSDDFQESGMLDDGTNIPLQNFSLKS